MATVLVRHSLPQPKNGSGYVAVIAGGSERTTRDIADKLKEHRGIDAKYLLDFDHPKLFERALPSDADFVLLLTDANQHKLSMCIEERAAEQKLPIVKSSRRWALLSQVIDAYGLVTVPAWQPVCVASPSKPRISMVQAQAASIEAKLPVAVEPQVRELQRGFLTALAEVCRQMPACTVKSVMIVGTEVTIDWE